MPGAATEYSSEVGEDIAQGFMANYLGSVDLVEPIHEEVLRGWRSQQPRVAMSAYAPARLGPCGSAIVSSVCPNPQVLERFALGRVAPTELEALAVHVETCSQCIAALRQIERCD